ncbi:MAG: DUF4224 domain-containing protein [Planctomycetaceae bacterium]|jgi:hypothetical protein|nr:DUF4224 domain-containing protein [Planctomycetaceae bacterium]
MFLSSEELAMLTGYRRPTFQKKWLAKLGVRYIENSRGHPLLAKSEVERILTSAGEATSNYEVNYDALKTRFTSPA